VCAAVYIVNAVYAYADTADTQTLASFFALPPPPPPSSVLLAETPRRNPCSRHPNTVCPDSVCSVQGDSRWERPYPPGEAGVRPIGVLLPIVLPVRIVLCRSVLYSAARCRAHLRAGWHMRCVSEDISWNVWCWCVIVSSCPSHPLVTPSFLLTGPTHPAIYFSQSTTITSWRSEQRRAAVVIRAAASISRMIAPPRGECHGCTRDVLEMY
jgi:hypothetical protein